jgi:BNR/Asp-box repeat protein
MSFVSLPRGTAVAGIASVALLGSGFALATASATAPKAPKTVKATRITRQSGTLRTGSHVRSGSVVGQRTFTTATTGFALASVGSADYAVTTADGGKTWKTDGPALHLHALQAPLAVSFLGAVSRKTVFAWGSGQVIDATNDGGKTWYRALFTSGSPVAVVHDLAGHLVAFVQSFSGSSTVQYVSKDGGRTWRH